MHITWVVALNVVLGERKRKYLTPEEADHFLYVVYRRTIPLETHEAIRQVREILDDPKEARRLTT
jgi:hypothetical protein